MPTPTPDRKPKQPDSPGGADLWPTHKLPLEELRTHLDGVLAEMVKNRDVKWDRDGRPLASVRSSGETAECSWVHLVVDMSAIGMPTDTPLIAHSYEGDTFLAWNLGPTPLAQTPKSATPKEAADALNMDVLLAGFRRFVAADSVLFPTSLTPHPGKDRGPVFIDPEKGCCHECGGTLEVTGVDDVTMTVECSDGCGASFDLEHDAFDGAVTDYVLEFLARRGDL